MSFKNSFLLRRSSEIGLKRGKDRSEETTGSGQETVVVAEPDSVELGHIANLLENLQYVALKAQDGDTALHLIREHRPVLVIASLDLPGTDGYKLFQFLREDDRTENIPFVFITAPGQIPDVVIGHQSYANDYIQKPISIPELKTRINSIMKLSGRVRQQAIRRARSKSEATEQGAEGKIEEYLKEYRQKATQHRTREASEGDEIEVSDILQGFKDPRRDTPAVAAPDPIEPPPAQTRVDDPPLADPAASELKTEAPQTPEDTIEAYLHEYRQKVALSPAPEREEGPEEELDSILSGLKGSRPQKAAKDPSITEFRPSSRPPAPPEPVVPEPPPDVPRRRDPDKAPRIEAYRPERPIPAQVRVEPAPDVTEAPPLKEPPPSPEIKPSPPPDRETLTLDVVKPIPGPLEKADSQAETWFALQDQIDLPGRSGEESVSDILGAFISSAPDHTAAADPQTLEERITEEEVNQAQSTDYSAESQELAVASEVPEAYTRARRYVAEALLRATEGQPLNLIQGTQIVEALIDQIEKGSEILIAATRRDQKFTVVSHSVNVAVIALKVGLGLGLSREHQLRIGLAALLHEVGMVKIPSELLDRSAPLRPGEMEIMRQRPIFAAQILNKQGPQHAALAHIVSQIFERENGSGFPRRLTGKDIAEEAKVIGIADVFEACIHPRPYRAALTGYQALFELTTSGAKGFGDRIIKALIRSFSLYPYNELVVLNTGEIGKVIEIHGENLSRPQVKILFDAQGQSVSTPSIVDLSENPGIYITKAISESR